MQLEGFKIHVLAFTPICFQGIIDKGQKKELMAGRRLSFALFFFFLFSGTFSDFAADQKECGSQLATLSSCIPYVQGSNKIPTKDCCDGLLQIHKANPKCLCVLIKDSSNPQLGIAINLTLALELPMICKVQTNVSTCPGLLHMAPNSPEAQVFNSTVTSSSPVSAAPNTSSSANSSSTSTSESSSYQLIPSMFWPGLVLGLPYVIFSLYRDTMYLFWYSY